MINFKDWPLDRTSAPAGYAGPVAADFPACLRIVEEKVKPQRATNNRKIYRDYWWQFAEKRIALHAALQKMNRVIARGEVANMHAMAMLPTSYTFSNKLCIFTLPEWGSFAVLQSSIHEIWARYYAPTMKSDMSYSVSDCFETFPMLPASERLSSIGDRYHTTQQRITLDSRRGLTATYNRFHDPAESAEDIRTLRELHVQMDGMVAAAYGWDDLVLGHDLHPTKQGTRFTINDTK